MQIKPSFPAWIVLAVLAAVPVTTRADPWTPSDDYSDGTSAANPLAIDSDGTYVYVVGSFGESALVRRRPISGGAWKTKDTFILPGGHFAIAQAVVYDAAKATLYVFGQGDNANDNLGTNHWWVRATTDQGETWTTIHTGTYFAKAGTNSVGDARLSTDNGKLYVVLNVQGETSNNTQVAPEWLVLSSPDGMSWSTLTTNQGLSGGQAYGTAVGFDGLGQADTAGYIIDSQGFNGDAYVSGNPWTQWDHVANYQPFDLFRVNGVNYSCGAGDLDHPWIVRENKGSGWIALETYAPGGDVGAQKMTSQGGVLYIAGYRGDNWYVRKSSPTGFTDSDVYTDGIAMSIVVAGGHLYAAGNHLDGNNVSHWIVREL